MSLADPSANDPVTPPATPSAPVAEDSLGRRTALTVLSNLFIQFSSLFAGLVLTPITASALGASIFGAYLVIQQILSYLSFADLSPGGGLKYLFGISQHDKDFSKKRRQIGAALWIWALTSPLLLVVGVIVAFASPFFIPVEKLSDTDLRWAVGVFLFSLFIDRLMKMPRLILRGMNMDYKFMGLNVVVTLLGSGLVCAAAAKGYGLFGMGVATIIGSICIGIAALFAAKRALPWLGVERPSPGERKEFFQLSNKVVGSSFGAFLFDNADILVVGALLGTRQAAVYAATAYLIRTAKGLLRNVMQSTTQSIAGLCGAGEWGRVLSVRRELQGLFIVGDGIVVGTVVVINHLFVPMWLGPEYYGGGWLTLFLGLSAIFELPLFVEGLLLNGRMEFRVRTVTMWVGGIVTIVVGGLLSKQFGPAGFAGAYAVVRGMAYLIFASNNAKAIEGADAGYVGHVFKPIACASALAVAGLLFQRVPLPVNGLSLAVSLVLGLGVSAGVMWFVAIDQKARKAVVGRLGSLTRMFRRRAKA
jgi:O-antigen/teichoic acid export membrane protein